MMLAKRFGMNVKEGEIAYNDWLVEKEKDEYFGIPVLKLCDNSTIHGTVAIINYMAYNSCLNGQGSRYLNAAISSWLYNFKKEIDELTDKVLLPILGLKDYTTESYQAALYQFNCFLKHLNNKVDNNLIGSTRTIADIFGAALLYLPFELIIDEEQQKTYCRVVDWFKKVTSDCNFIKFFGQPKFCRTASSPPQSANDTTTQNANWSDPFSDSETTPIEKGNERPGKEESDEDKVDSVDEILAETKPWKNPLDSLPPTTFDLDDLKSHFATDMVDTDNAVFYLESTFWNMFDNVGWSIWHIEYSNSNDDEITLGEGITFSSDFLASISEWNKYGFGAHGCFQTSSENKNDVHGIYLWRGTDIPFFMDNNPHLPFYEIRKMNPKWSKDRNMLKDLWCEAIETASTNFNGILKARSYFR